MSIFPNFFTESKDRGNYLLLLKYVGHNSRHFYSLPFSTSFSEEQRSTATLGAFAAEGVGEHCELWENFRDLVPFVQAEKREKHPCRL